jgi:hypothetical protein
MNQHPADVLQEARALISDPAKWTQCSFARDAKGKSLFSGYNKDAVCWCAMGAIEKVLGKDLSLDLTPYTILKDTGYIHITDWPPSGVTTYNDRSTHQEVLSLFDKAIENAKEME